MTFVACSDWYLKVQLGLVDGVSIVNKFGANRVVSTSVEDIWTVGGTYTGWLTAAETIDVISNSANDDAAGTGARQVKVLGLDENFESYSETVDLVGSGTAATTGTFTRVFRAFVVNSGAYDGTNVADIDLQGTTSASVVAEIPILEGQTSMAIYTVPAGYTASLGSINVNVGRAMGSNIQPANLRFWKREDMDHFVAPFGPPRLQLELAGVTGNQTYVPRGPFMSFPEKTDLWWDGVRAGSSDVNINVDFELMLTKNSIWTPSS